MLTCCYVGKLSRVMRSQPAYSDLLGPLGQLCAETVSIFEFALEKQREFDRTEARRQEEQQRRREGLARKMAERNEQVKQVKSRAMEREKQEIEAAEMELAARKKALCQVENGIHEDQDDNDNPSQSAADEHVVSGSPLYFMNTILITEIDLIRGPSTPR